MLFIGGFFLLWGVLVVYSSLFRMKEEDFKSKSRIGASGYIELELLVRWLSCRLPLKIVKSSVLLIGVSLIGAGSFILLATNAT